MQILDLFGYRLNVPDEEIVKFVFSINRVPLSEKEIFEWMESKLAKV